MVKADNEKEEILSNEHINLLKKQRDHSIAAARNEEGAGDSENLESLSIQVHKLKQQMDLQKSLQEKKHSEALEKVRELEENNLSLKLQLENLKEETARNESKQLKNLREEKDRLEVMLGELRLHADQLEKGMQYLRTKAEEGKTDSNQLGMELALAQDKIITLESDLQAAKSITETFSRQKDKLNEANAILQAEVQRTQSELEQVKSQLESTEEERKEKQTQLDKLAKTEKEKAEALSTKEQLVTTLQQEVYKLYEASRTLRSQMDEREGQLKTAQQHLAKKVRENAILNEKCEEQKEKLSELQKNLNETQSKMYETENILKSHLAQEKRMQEQLDEAVKSVEIQSQRWEEKYFKLYDKWVETETLNKELKKLEEKQNQMQALLSSLGNVLSSSPSPSPQQKEPLEPPSTNYKKNLFE